MRHRISSDPILHFFVEPCVFLESDALLLDHFFELVSGDLRALLLNLLGRQGHIYVFFVASIHFEIELGGHAHRSRTCSFSRAESLQIEDIFVPAMCHILPWFGFCSIFEVKGTLVVLAPTGLIIKDISACPGLRHHRHIVSHCHSTTSIET